MEPWYERAHRAWAEQKEKDKKGLVLVIVNGLKDYATFQEDADAAARLLRLIGPIPIKDTELRYLPVPKTFTERHAADLAEQGTPVVFVGVSYRNDDMELVVGDKYFHVETGAVVTIGSIDEEKQELVIQIDDGGTFSEDTLSIDAFRSQYDVNEYGEQ